VSDLQGLVVDWGGVLTGDIRSAVHRWAAGSGFDVDAYISIMRDWFGEPVGLEARMNPVHALERGEMAVPDFEARLAEEMERRTGLPLAADGLLDRMIGEFEVAHDMNALVRRARRHGLRTGLLSNSWGNDYPRDGWDEMFDVVVISGEVGMRKPEPAIFQHTVDLLGLPAAACVFVDDLPPNVAAAVDVGMVGVHHTSYDATRAELEALFGLDLAG
jgi:HAD superfamily hydrolase (TIGR01509 family)